MSVRLLIELLSTYIKPQSGWNKAKQKILIITSSKLKDSALGAYLRRYPNRRKRTQKMMQAVPIWMPMTMLPREASPSRHWHRLFPPVDKKYSKRENIFMTGGFNRIIIWHRIMFFAHFSGIFHSTDIIVLNQGVSGPLAAKIMLKTHCSRVSVC